jgi:hypothetical protein
MMALPRAFSSFTQVNSTSVENGTLQDISASSWTRLHCFAGRSGGESPGYHPLVPGERTAHSLSQPHGLVHHAPEYQPRIIRRVKSPAQPLRQETARRGWERRPLVQEWPLPRRKVSCHASLLVEGKEALERTECSLC